MGSLYKLWGGGGDQVAYRSADSGSLRYNIEVCGITLEAVSGYGDPLVVASRTAAGPPSLPIGGDGRVIRVGDVGVQAAEELVAVSLETLLPVGHAGEGHVGWVGRKGAEVGAAFLG